MCSSNEIRIDCGLVTVDYVLHKTGRLDTLLCILVIKMYIFRPLNGCLEI